MRKSTLPNSFHPYREKNNSLSQWSGPVLLLALTRRRLCSRKLLTVQMCDLTEFLKTKQISFVLWAALPSMASGPMFWERRHRCTEGFCLPSPFNWLTALCLLTWNTRVVLWLLSLKSFFSFFFFLLPLWISSKVLFCDRDETFLRGDYFTGVFPLSWKDQSLCPHLKDRWMCSACEYTWASLLAELGQLSVHWTIENQNRNKSLKSRAFVRLVSLTCSCCCSRVQC